MEAINSVESLGLRHICSNQFTLTDSEFWCELLLLWVVRTLLMISHEIKLYKNSMLTFIFVSTNSFMTIMLHHKYRDRSWSVCCSDDSDSSFWLFCSRAWYLVFSLCNASKLTHFNVSLFLIPCHRTSFQTLFTLVFCARTGHLVHLWILSHI